MRKMLARRVERLDAGRTRTAMLADADRLVADLGMPAAELLADAVAFAGRCRAVGAITRAEIVALAAVEQGREAAKLQAEVDAAMARWDG